MPTWKNGSWRATRGAQLISTSAWYVTAEPPPPEVHWPDQTPLYLDGTFDERLNEWLTLVQRSEVVAAYRVFLGLLEDEANRHKLLAQLVFAGLIDIQDRMLFNRSYTTG